MQRDLLLLDEIAAASRRATDIASRYTAEELTDSLDARDALLWNLTVVGEATGQLSSALRDGYPEVPWSQPVRLRNRIVHGYWSVDLDVIHAVALQDLPDFATRVAGIAEGLSRGE